MGSAKQKLDTFLEHAYTEQIKELNGTTAMAKINMLKTIVSGRRQPHSAVDNVNTPLNSIRLLHGAPPGQCRVNHYMSELSIEKNHKASMDGKQRKHLAMLEATDDEYNYHQKLCQSDQKSLMPSPQASGGILLLLELFNVCLLLSKWKITSFLNSI